MELNRIIIGNTVRDLDTGEISVEIVSGILPVGTRINSPDAINDQNNNNEKSFVVATQNDAQEDARVFYQTTHRDPVELYFDKVQDAQIEAWANHELNAELLSAEYNQYLLENRMHLPLSISKKRFVNKNQAFRFKKTEVKIPSKKPVARNIKWEAQAFDNILNGYHFSKLFRAKHPLVSAVKFLFH